MLAIILSLLIVSDQSGGGSKGPHAAKKADFSFKDYQASKLVSDEEMKDCSKNGDVITCVQRDQSVAGYKSYIQGDFYNGRLSRLFVFPLNPQNVNIFDMVVAFREKYGAPCSEKETVWKSAMGVVLENPTYVWCFSTGKLTVSKYGSSVTNPDIYYEDVNQPKSKPKVDF
jgi:hypothetical protein